MDDDPVDDDPVSGRSSAGTGSTEEGLARHKVELSYGAYLHLDELLGAQHPVSRPAHHDELLFIIQHQTSELWLKLVLHELRRVSERLAADDLRPALKGLARVKHIQRQLSEQWSVLATLTPAEYSEFRQWLGTSSGFQSWQYRAMEFVLGNKDAGMLATFDYAPGARALLEEALARPTVYDEFLRYLARRGYPVPVPVLERDVSRPWVLVPELVVVFRDIYRDTDRHWETYEACEELVDLEDNVQLWRFRHLQTVQRTIGTARGTGGSSGVGFLRGALDRSFFPELYAVRTEIPR